MKRKIVSVLLVAVMLLTCIPLGALGVSAEEYVQGVYTYTVVEGEATITAYHGAGGNVVIPDTLGGYPVVQIGREAFYENQYIVSVKIPSTVETIGDSAFYQCLALESVDIPEGVTILGESAFNGTALTSVVIPDSVTNLGQSGWGIFAYCKKLNRVKIGKGLSNIGGEMFVGCSSLTSIEIPENIKRIESFAFTNTGLTSIVIPETVEYIAPYQFISCRSLTSVTLPKHINRIDDSWFNGCTSLTNFNIPEGVSSIGLSAFLRCTNLTTITIPKSVTCIEGNAFDECTALTEVYYAGSEEDRANIFVDINDNDPLLNATWHYNCINPKDHYSVDVSHSVMDTDSGTGLAFKFELNASVGVKGVNKVDFTGATINYLGQTCKLVGAGAVVTNQGEIIPNLDNVNGKTVIDIPTVYLTDWEPDSCAFATRIINIPESALERTVYACPYYTVEVNGELITVYGDISSASCAEYM